MAVGVPKFEGQDHTFGEMGIPILAVRNDAGTVIEGVDDKKYTVLTTDSSGALRVTSAGGGGGGTEYTEGATDATITGTAVLWEDTSDTLRAVSAAKPLPVNVVSGVTIVTEYTEDAAAAANPVGPMSMARRKDSLSASEVTTDGDNIALNATSKGELYVKQTDAISVTGTVTVDTELAAAAALADATANPTVPTVGAGLLMYNGSTWDRVRGDTTNGVDVDVTRVPAAARTTDSIAAALQTDAIMSNLTALTPKFAAIAASTSGNNTLVAAVTSKKIRVLGLYLVSNGSVNAKFQSGASGTDLTGLAYLVANTGFVLPFNAVGWFETASNALLNLNLSNAIAVGGALVYVEV